MGLFFFSSLGILKYCSQLDYQRLCSSEQSVLCCCNILLHISGHISPQGVNISFGLAEKASMRNTEAEASTCAWSRGARERPIFLL